MLHLDLKPENLLIEGGARGKDGREYPWGNEAPDVTRAQFGKSRDGCDYTKRVGSFLTGASAVGALDMAGNVWEWCEDWYDCRCYKSCGEGMRNPTGPASGSSRVLRGGAWSYRANRLRSAFRNSNHPFLWNNSWGFRAAMSLAR